MIKNFGFQDRHSPFRFNPATLFIGGAIKGAFYNPSDIKTLFQDDAGTTSVTAVEQTVGLILDLSGNANHATQSVAASRPTYRARYNLLTYSEQFDNVAWSKGNGTISTNSTVAPNGTQTADTFTTTAATAATFVQQAFTSVASAYVFSVYVKTNGVQFVQLLWSSAQSTNFANFDLSAGTIGTNTATSATITAVGNGWYRIAIVSTLAAAAGAANIYCVSTSTSGRGSSFAGNGTSGVFVWGAQLTQTAVFPSNTYQRIEDVTTYDTGLSFPPYLSFDGSNDSLLTNNVDFTSTNKMTVWAGLTKSSDAAQGAVVELSATIASNNGTFLLSAPNSAAANYNWSSKGTTQVDNTVTTYAAPNTAVLTGQADIAAPSNIIRVNGAQAGSVATTQGAGNFGNYPLYIGRRNNATLPFNGRLYGLIVLGAAASAYQVWATEQWMAQQTGLQF